MYLPSLAATLHIGVRRSGVARVDEVRVALGGGSCTAGTRQAMGLVAGSRANMDYEVGKCTAGDTDRIVVDGTGQVAEVVGAGEHVGCAKVSSIQRLVPPRERPIEATLISQDLLEGPHEVAVPHQELGVVVDVGHVLLVQTSQILIPVGRRREVARRRLVHQALDGTDEGQAVRSRVLSPFEAHVGVRRARCR